MSSQTPVIDDQTLAMMRCPITHSPLRLSADRHALISQVGGLSYPIRDGIPCLLPEEAKLPAGIDSLDEFKKKFVIQS